MEDLKNGLIKERNEALKEEIYARYSRYARWGNVSFDGKNSRFELADFDNEFTQEMLQKYDITYIEYLNIYCEVRNDGFFYPDEINDIDVFVKGKLRKVRQIS